MFTMLTMLATLQNFVFSRQFCWATDSKRFSLTFNSPFSLINFIWFLMFSHKRDFVSSRLDFSSPFSLIILHREVNCCLHSFGDFGSSCLTITVSSNLIVIELSMFTLSWFIFKINMFKKKLAKFKLKCICQEINNKTDVRQCGASASQLPHT